MSQWQKVGEEKSTALKMLSTALIFVLTEQPGVNAVKTEISVPGNWKEVVL